MRPFFKACVARILTVEARLVLHKYRPKVIAVTGSAGKTSTKDAIFAAIAKDLFVRKSEKSYNSEIGVPLAILGCESAWGSALGWLGNILHGLSLIVLPHEYPAWLVLEVGADRPGDIRSIARWLRPDIAVITSIPNIPVHVEFFSSPEALAREKRSLAEFVKPSGTLVVNGDDERGAVIYDEFRGIARSFGFSDSCDYVASREGIMYNDAKPAGVRFRVDHEGSSVPVEVSGALGRPRILAALAALAVADTVGVDFIAAAAGLLAWMPPPGRMRIVPGIKESVILDDTYNSSPSAALAALETLREVRAKKRIAVLGDMLELGKYSTEAHREIGRIAAVSADLLVTVGFRAKALGEAALDAGMDEKKIRQYEAGESRRAGKELEEEMGDGVVVLIKGSQSMRMERAVIELMAEPDRAPELLVRMEEEWEKR